MLITNNPNLNKISYGFSFLFIAVGGIQQYLTSYFSSLGEPNMGFNILLILYFFVFLSNFYASYVIAYFGVKRTILFSTVVYILAHVAIVMEYKWIAYLGAMIIGLVGAMLWNSQNSYILGISTSENRGHNSGFFMAIYEIGSTIGILIVGYFSGIYGYQNSFFLVAFISFISLLLFGTMDNIKEAELTTKSTSFSALKSKSLVQIAMLNSLIYFMLIGLAVSLLPLHIYLVTQSGLIVGTLSGFFFFMPVLLSKRAGSYSDRHGRAVVVLVAFLVGIVGLLILHFSRGLFSLSLATILVAISQSMLAPIFIAIQGDVSTTQNQSLVTTVFIFFKYIGLMIGIAIGSIFGIEWGYLVVITIIVLTMWFAYGVMEDMEVVCDKIFEEIKNEK